MAIPPQIAALIERLNQELDQIEQEAIEGLNFVRRKLSSFPDNALLIQVFAYLNNFILFVETSRRRIEYSQVILATDIATNEQIQEIGENLATLLGSTLEAKVDVSRIITRLEN